jgi:hypothetical protein
MGSKKTTTTRRTEIAPWLEAGSQQAVALGRQIGSQPYQAYGGQRVAGLSENEQTALGLAQQGGSEARSYLDRAGAQLDSMQAYSGDRVREYMNPYLENVLNPALRKTGEAFDARRTQLRNNAAKVNAFGGDRQSLLESQLDKNYLETVGDITSKANYDAWANAQEMFFRDEERKLRAADAYARVGGDISRMNSAQIQDLMATGGLSRVLEQAKLDFDYQQFIENRDWNIRNLGPLIESLRVPASSTQTDTTREKGGALGQILGAAATVATAYFTGGASLGLAGLGKAAAVAAPSLAEAAVAPSLTALMGHRDSGVSMSQALGRYR